MITKTISPCVAFRTPHWYFYTISLTLPGFIIQAFNVVRFIKTNRYNTADGAIYFYGIIIMENRLTKSIYNFIHSVTPESLKYNVQLAVMLMLSVKLKSIAGVGVVN